MNNAMYKRYENVRPIGVIYICNTFGIVVYEPDNVDKYKDNCDLIAAWYNGEKTWGYHKHEMFFTNAGRMYIRKGSLRIYLDEVTAIH